MRLKDKITLVTGAASGFGRGIAETFRREGAQVAVVDLNGEGAAAVAADLGEGAIAIPCDVAQGDQVQAAVRQVMDRYGRLDVVVNNAGWTNPNQPLMETDEATFRKIYDINVLSIFHMTKACVPVRKTRPVSSVYLSSRVARISDMSAPWGFDPYLPLRKR